MRTEEGQGVKTAEHQILTRIGFAERWLQRAREECLDGDVARGLLTLVLADAEVRRVLQLAVSPAARSRSPLRAAVAVFVGLVIATAVALQLGVLAIGAASVESAGLAPGLLLRSGTGALFEPLGAAGPQEPVQTAEAPATPAQPAAAKPMPIHPRNGSVFPVPAQRSAPPVLAARPPAPSPVPVASASTAAAAPDATAVEAPAPPAALSGVDLLDLVIVADRTLRRSQP